MRLYLGDAKEGRSKKAKEKKKHTHKKTNNSLTMSN